MTIRTTHEVPLADWLTLVNKIVKEKKLKRKDIAHNAGLSNSYVSEILNGKKEPRLSSAIALMLAVGFVPQITFEDVK
jgi:transcriptional regulator with XRE-family HTH domain